MHRVGAWKALFSFENLYSAGNPAVMAPRFRPVALRTPPFGGFATNSQTNMPKKTHRHKRSRLPMRNRAGLKSVTAPTLHSVKDLLSGRLATLTRVTDPA